MSKLSSFLWNILDIYGYCKFCLFQSISLGGYYLGNYFGYFSQSKILKPTLDEQKWFIASLGQHPF